MSGASQPANIDKKIVMKSLTVFLLLVALTPLLTYAHPGHGETEGWSIIHYFIEWPHILITWPSIVAVVLLSVIVWRRGQQEKTGGDA